MITTPIDTNADDDGSSALLERLEKLFRPLAVLIVAAALLTIWQVGQRPPDEQLRASAPESSPAAAPLSGEWSQRRPATRFDDMYRSR